MARRSWDPRKERGTKGLRDAVGRVNDLELTVLDLRDAALRARTDEFRARLADGETLDGLLPEVFATVREVTKRRLGQRLSDGQVLGGVALHQGSIVEMEDAEGHLLTCMMPAYLNALAGRGVHVATGNPYVASRDKERTGRVYSQTLGLSVGLVHAQQPQHEKRDAYLRDITYGTSNELGFDFLRDHMVLSPQEKVQRGHSFVILREADSILIDEASTPLIISGAEGQASEWYAVFARRVAPHLAEGEHYLVDHKMRTISVTEAGIERVEQLLGVANLYEGANTSLVHHLQNAIRAKELYRRGREYAVNDGEVLIVDEHTGQTLPGRRYDGGLHQAIEAKEGVWVKDETQTLAKITVSNYLRIYEKLAGITATAKTDESELTEIYARKVVCVPANDPAIRVDRPDQIFKTEKAKLDAILQDITERYERGQPLLVGTVSIEKSERLSAMLMRRGILHEVLNATNRFREAAIVAQAGRIGAVTVATNVACRGVDIMLGGNPEALADVHARADAQQEDGTVDQPLYARLYAEALADFKIQCQAEDDRVRALGGLYVLGTERHESRRIDHQLRAQAGSRGDPGESRFYLSLEDDLMRLFNASAVESILTSLRMPEDVPIEHKMVTRAVARAQAQVESRNFVIRKNWLRYDDVMNAQREVIYAERDVVLEGTDDQVEELAESFVQEAVRDLVNMYAAGVSPAQWSLDELWAHLQEVYPVRVRQEQLDLGSFTSAQLAELLVDDALAWYDERDAVLSPEVMWQVERRAILSAIDRVWREHLRDMEHLRDGIGLRAVGQRDPFVEYQREAGAAFEAVRARIKWEAARDLFNTVAPPVQAEPEPESPPPTLRTQRLSYTSAEVADTPERGSTPTRVSSPIGRNYPCPCGSGMRYKHCHGT